MPRATGYQAIPQAMPMAAATQILAAVVRPRTMEPWRMMVPAPRKPTPVTIWAAMRAGSLFGPTKDAEIMVNSAEPRETIP